MFPDLKLEIERLRATNRFREMVPLRSREGVYVFFKEKKLIDFTNWDLFDVTSNPEVLKAIHRELESVGLGGNPRLACGTFLHHLALEKRIARFLGFESAALFTSRNQAVLSLVTALLDERSIAIVDELLQSPVADAAFLVNACIASFKPEDLDTLAVELEKSPESFKKVVFIESVSPLRGVQADLESVIRLAEQHKAAMIIDESFSLGVTGLRGGGCLELLPPGQRPFCSYGSLSYGLSGIGAFVAGDRVLIDFLVNQSRTFAAEGALPPCLAAGMEAALNSVELDSSGRERLKTLGLRLKRGLILAGLPVDEVAFPLICIPFEKYSAASRFADALVTRGFLTEVIPKGGLLDAGAILRVLINVEHSETHIDLLLQAIADLLTLLRK